MKKGIRLKQQMAGLDREKFTRLYHDPAIRAADVAKHFGLNRYRLNEVARFLGIQTRREAGVYCCGRRKEPPPPLLPLPGQGGCKESCCMWSRCKAGEFDQTLLPCELSDAEAGILDEDELWLAEAEIDPDSFVLYRFPVNVVVNGQLAKEFA